MSVTRNFGPLEDIKLTDRGMMREIGLMARERIVRRTRAGVSTSGQSFRPYSDSYRVRKAKEVNAGRVNLTLSGAMLNDIQLVRITDDTVELGFSR